MKRQIRGQSLNKQRVNETGCCGATAVIRQVLAVFGKTSGKLGLDLVQRREDDVADYGQAARADFVEGVLRRVPVAQHLIVSEVNEVHGGDAPFEKRDMIVADGAEIAGGKNVPVA